MSVTTDTTVTPIFDELAARLGLVWDVDASDLDAADLDAATMDAAEVAATDEPAEAEPEAVAS